MPPNVIARLPGIMQALVAPDYIKDATSFAQRASRVTIRLVCVRGIDTKRKIHASFQVRLEASCDLGAACSTTQVWCVLFLHGYGRSIYRDGAFCLMVWPGFCSQDYSNTCPLGWMQDINQDCLAPVEYSGKCVVRKSFADMGASDKSTWAKLCDVTW